VTAPSATLSPGKYPRYSPTFRICAPYNARPVSQFAARQMVAIRRHFIFFNTTGGLIVMPFRLCQEGSWEPMIERIVFANGSF